MRKLFILALLLSPCARAAESVKIITVQSLNLPPAEMAPELFLLRDAALRYSEVPGQMLPHPCGNIIAHQARRTPISYAQAGQYGPAPWIWPAYDRETLLGEWGTSELKQIISKIRADGLEMAGNFLFSATNGQPCRFTRQGDTFIFDNLQTHAHERVEVGGVGRGDYGLFKFKNGQVQAGLISHEEEIILVDPFVAHWDKIVRRFPITPLHQGFHIAVHPNIFAAVDMGGKAPLGAVNAVIYHGAGHPERADHPEHFQFEFDLRPFAQMLGILPTDFFPFYPDQYRYFEHNGEGHLFFPLRYGPPVAGEYKKLFISLNLETHTAVAMDFAPVPPLLDSRRPNGPMEGAKNIPLLFEHEAGKRTLTYGVLITPEGELFLFQPTSVQPVAGRPATGKVLAHQKIDNPNGDTFSREPVLFREGKRVFLFGITDSPANPQAYVIEILGLPKS